MVQNRTHTCGELRLTDAGKQVKLSGWMENIREVGAELAFIVLRDFYGTTQIVAETPEMVAQFKAVNKESTISVEGTVRERASKNPKLPTGDIEVVPVQVSVLGRCRHNELPFQINRSRECHIITLEDPIEYLHRDVKSIVSQREIRIDTADYLSALRACLRQAPDVILLGEMRDQETIHTAMSAAETGHLLIATLHTKGAVNTIDRIVDTFPSGQQEQVRIQLSMVLHTVVSQQLLPDKDGELPGKQGEMIPAFEVMHMNNAIRSLVRENKTHQIDNAIAAGKAEGMISMDQSILGLYQAGLITPETALEYADNPDQMRRRLAINFIF